MTSKKLLPAVFALAAIMLGSGFGAAQAMPQTIQTFETQEQINLEEISNILETQTIVEIESQDKLTFVALEEQVLVLDETEKLVAIIGEELQQTAVISEDVKVIPTELAQVKELATDADSRLVIVQEEVLTVVDTEEILTEQVPQIAELTVVDADAFWETSTLQIRDATITTDKDVIVITEDAKVHVFEALSTQAVEYQQIPTTVTTLETVIANPIAIDELNEVVAIVDEDRQLVLIQTEQLIQNTVEQVIPVTTEAIPTDVEIATVDTEITKVIVVENEWIEKFSVDTISEQVLEVEAIQFTLTTPVVEEIIVEAASPIAITLDEEKTLLALFADNRIAEFDQLAIELGQPTNEITSIVKIVGAEDAALSSCSVNIVDGQINYGIINIGAIADTKFDLATEGSPIVSVMGTEWITADGEIVMDAQQTHYQMIETDLTDVQMDQIAYAEMAPLMTEPVTVGQIFDEQEKSLLLKLQVPTTITVEELEAQQTVSVLAEC